MQSKMVTCKSKQNCRILGLAGWGLLVCVYIFSLQQNYFLKIWDYLIFFIQLACDIIIGIAGFFAYRLQKNKCSRMFYLLFFISIIPGLFANEIYNILINIIEISKNNYLSVYWSLAYSVFLLIQLIAWGYLLKKTVVQEGVAKKSLLTVYPYVFSASAILLALTFIVVIRSGTSDQIGNYRIFNSILEIIVFTLLSFSLSRTKNFSLIYLEIGFLLLIGFNFAHRFSDMLSIYYKAFNVVWLLCLIVISYGFMSAVRDRNEEIQFYVENSIHVLTIGAFILFANFVLMVFVISAFGLSVLQIDKIPHFGMLALDIPSALVFSYSLTMLLAKSFAYRLSTPLDDVVKKIDRIGVNNRFLQVNNEEKIVIDEVQKVERFIIKTISELHHANQVKSEFLMNMSHDFRTPASGIQYMSRLIHDRLVEPDLKRLQKMVVNSSDQLMVLLEDVLDYSRLENDNLKLNYQHFDIVNMIDELIEVMTAKAEERNLTVVSKLQHETMPYYSDQTIIKRIILNLLSNALKFTDSGTVSILADMELRGGDARWAIRIKDTGIGIDPSNHSFIFEPFYRVESADSAKYSGIGLGLSNVKLMLKKIGGAISLESALGCGSEFTIFLPIGKLSS